MFDSENSLVTDRWFPIPEAALSHKEQRRLRAAILDDSGPQFLVISAGRRSFKTERFAKRDAVRYCLENRGKRVFCGAPTRTQAKSIFWRDLQDLVPSWAKGSVGQTDLVIHFRNGSELHVVGLEAHRRIEGVRWDRAYITEMQEVPEEFFSSTLEPILNDTGGRGIFEGRPVRRDYFFDMFNRQKQEPNRWASFTWTSEGILTEEQIENAKRTLAEEDYKREYLASFDIGGQRVYYAFSEENLLEYEINHALPLIVTFDFNSSVMPFSVNIGQEFDGKTYWYKSFSHTYTNTEQMCEILDQEFLSWRHYPAVIELYGDYSGGRSTSNSTRSDWETIQTFFRGKTRTNLHTKPCQKIRDRVAATNARLRNVLGEVRMYVHPQNCTALIEDFLRVQWASNGIQLDGRDPKRTHSSDSVDYYSYYAHPVQGKIKGSIRSN